MWWLDLDELEQLNAKTKLVSYNRFNLFSFYDRDHLLGETNTKSNKENVISYLKANGVNWIGGKIFLLTNLRTLGYLFNPVSFYFCFNPDGSPLCSIAEVGNTYYELKPFLLTDFTTDQFNLRIKKHFYVSPFTNLDDEFDFQVAIPGEKLNIRIDDYHDNQRFFISTLTGNRKAMTFGSVLASFLRFPFITLRVIALIHWQAFKLWLKKIPFHAKAANPELQQQVMRKHKSIKTKIS